MIILEERGVLETVLTWVSLIGTPISFAIAIWTLKNTQTLKNQINAKLDLKELSEKLQNYEEKLDNYNKMISNNMYDDSQLFHLRELLAEISQRYPNINKTIISCANEGIKLLTFPPNQELDIESNKEISRILTFIRNNLYKEVR